MKLFASHHCLTLFQLCHLHIEGEAPYADPKHAKSFKVNNFFVGSNVRKGVQEGRLDYLPIFLSEVPRLFRRNVLPLDAALVQVSPPDKHGFCSLGVSVDASLAAVQCAKHVIAQVNKHMPVSTRSPKDPPSPPHFLQQLHSAHTRGWIDPRECPGCISGRGLPFAGNEDGSQHGHHPSDWKERGFACGERRHPSDGHRCYPRCSAITARPAQRPWHPHRNVFRGSPSPLPPLHSI